MIDDFIRERKLPLFRRKQFRHAYFRELISSYDGLTTWPKDLRTELAKSVPFSTLSARKSFISGNKDTQKTVFVTDKNWRIESVLMRHLDGRNTVCVSTMAGCPMGCVFCATGKMGFIGNLSDREIVDQVLYFARILISGQEKITNIVFMGMGEPLLNLTATETAIAVLTDPGQFAMSRRRITVSTSGILPNLRKFIRDGFDGRLAISLHAPDQKLRDTLMPGVAKYPIHELMRVCDEFTAKTNRRITYEYILIKGTNDSPDDARALARLLAGRLAHVNLIPVNPVTGTGFVRPPGDDIRTFADILEKAGMPLTIRIGMGEDVGAACGQLATAEDG